MTRLAVGGKLGKPGNPPLGPAVAPAWASRLSNVESAAMPGTERPKKWRRFRRLGLLIGDDLVEVEDQAGDRGISGQLRGVQGFVPRGIALRQEFVGGFRIVPVSAREALECPFKDPFLFG